MTYSIVACDEAHLGVATASHSVAVGAIVPWTSPGIGAVATQAFTDPSYGPAGLARMQAGATPDNVIDSLLKIDSQRDYRQVVMLDYHGHTATNTGAGCLSETSSVTADNAAAAGNMLVSTSVPEAMLNALTRTPGVLAERLVEALRAGQAAGGDLRGRQAAALQVVVRYPQPKSGHGMGVNLRVDDHPDPINELSRLLAIQNRSSRIAASVFPTETGVLIQGDSDTLSRAIDQLSEIFGETDNANTEAAIWLALCHLRAGQPDTAKSVLGPNPELWDGIQRWAREFRAQSTNP